MVHLCLAFWIDTSRRSSHLTRCSPSGTVSWGRSGSGVFGIDFEVANSQSSCSESSFVIVHLVLFVTLERMKDRTRRRSRPRAALEQRLIPRSRRRSRSGTGLRRSARARRSDGSTRAGDGPGRVRSDGGTTRGRRLRCAGGDTRQLLRLIDERRRVYRVELESQGVAVAAGCVGEIRKAHLLHDREIRGRRVEGVRESRRGK